MENQGMRQGCITSKSDNTWANYDASVRCTSGVRFTQRDPKGFIDGVNRYAYAVNNPINYTDPRGTSVFNVGSTNSLTQSGSYYGTSTSSFMNLGTGSGSGVFSSGSQSFGNNTQDLSRIGDELNDIKLSAGLQAGGKIGVNGLISLDVNLNFGRSEYSVVDGSSGYSASYNIAIGVGDFSIGLNAEKFGKTKADFRSADLQISPFISKGNATVNNDYVLNIGGALIFGVDVQVNLSQVVRNIRNFFK